MSLFLYSNKIQNYLSDNFELIHAFYNFIRIENLKGGPSIYVFLIG